MCVILSVGRMPVVEVLLRMQGIRCKTERRFRRVGIYDGLDVTFQENVTFNTEKTSAPFRDPSLAKLRSVFARLTFGSPHKNFDSALLSVAMQRSNAVLRMTQKNDINANR